MSNLRLAISDFGFRISLSVIVLLSLTAASLADWPTHRGNAARTGCVDGSAGPAEPKVAWVHRSKQHFIASPVIDGGGLYVSGLGAFNTGHFHRLFVSGDRAGEAAWSKSAPFIKRPTVSPPAVVEGLVIFGDGMHQTDDAILYALSAETGRCIWQLPVNGKLVHVEGAPLVLGERVLVGGGDAGVLCVDYRRISLEGREVDPKTAQAEIDRRWAELLAKYAKDRQADPAMAIPPSEEDLPKPAPKLLWQQGKGQWHVDAPLAAAGDVVLAASAYLDEEKVGRRSLLCLSAADGKVRWDCPLTINPWAGATVAGDLVLVGCSNIRFDTRLLPQARGEVVAVGLADGKVRWRRELPGGVLGSIAVADGLAVVTATDGKLRGLNLADGKDKWTYDAGAAFFAAPAVAGGNVYAADLKAVLHAVSAADGRKLWSLGVAGDPAVRAPGMVFGSPVVCGGRIYLATCNVESASPEAACVVACVAEASTVAVAAAKAEVVVDRADRRVRIPCRVAPRKLPTLKEVYPIEVVATYPSPRGQKAHETVVTIDAACTDVHKGIEALGGKAGAPARGEEGSPTGSPVRLLIELPGANGRTTRLPIERVLIDAQTGRSLPPLTWRFTGSVMRQSDPNAPDRFYGADLSGTLATLFPVTDETVFQSNLTMRESRLLKLETNPDLLGAEGTPATLIVELVADEPARSPDRAPFVPLPPLATGPVEAPAASTAAAERWFLPSSDPAVEPKVLPLENAPVARSSGRPSVAPVRTPPREPSVSPPSGPRVSERAADPRAGPVLPIEAPIALSGDWRPLPPAAGTGRPFPDDDAMHGAARRVVLAAPPPVRSAPAALLPVSVPDPHAPEGALKMASVPPDDDPPADGQTLPPAPPVAPKP